MENRNVKKRKRTGIKQGGIRYACAVVWIIISCFGKHFFKNTSHVFRLRAMASLCVLAAAAVVLVEVSQSSMQVEDAHLIFCMSQKGNEVREGYEDPVVCDLVLENDGGNELTDVRLYIDGKEEGFSLESEGGQLKDGRPLESGEGSTMAPGDKWKAKIIMAPGRKAGEYFITVSAEAAELEKRIEQVIRFVVKEPMASTKPSASLKPSEDPGTDSSPKPGKPTGSDESPGPGESAEPEATGSGKLPAPGGTPGSAGADENTGGSKASGRLDRPGNGKPNVESQQTEVKNPDTELQKAGKLHGAEKDTPEENAVSKVGSMPKRGTVEEKAADGAEGGGTQNPKTSGAGGLVEQAEPLAEDEQDEAGDSDEIIRVDVPTDVRLLMNPMVSEENGQITSSLLPITNHSDFPLDIDIERGVLDIRQNGGLVRKNCSLNMDVFREDQVVVAIRNLREGINPIHTSFFLPSGNTAHIKFFGSLDAGTEYLWEDGDLSARIIFRFSKSGGK